MKLSAIISHALFNSSSDYRIRVLRHRQRMGHNSGALAKGAVQAAMMPGYFPVDGWAIKNYIRQNNDTQRP